MYQLILFALDNLPEVLPGTNLARMILEACRRDSFALETGDIVVITQKIVSKAEGRLVDLTPVTPGEEALKLAAQCNKDPRLVELILSESREILRVRPGLIIPETKHGLVSANAGIDASNTGDRQTMVLLLPVDPDDSAKLIRQEFYQLSGVRVAVVVNDSQGRPFRNGAIGIAIGCSGVQPLKVYVGEKDRDSKTLQSSVEAVGDEMASAASLLMGQAAEGRPVVIIRGLSHFAGEGQATDLVRVPALDMFR